MRDSYSIGKTLRIGGLLLTAVSLIAGITFALAVGGSCSFITGLGLIIVIFFSLLGVLVFLQGIILAKRRGSTNS